MVRRDRNRPSIVIWGVRINESENRPALYTRTKEAAKALDDSRPTSGAMNRYSTKDWVQESMLEFSHAGWERRRDPLPGVPYFLTEGVGQFAYGTPKGGFGRKYRRAADLTTQQSQAVAHAQIHSRAAAKGRMAGVIAWCTFDYGSPINSYQGVKTPGVADIFRIPKLGATFYLAQADPAQRVVIEPNFYWDFGAQSPSGPGPKSAIFSNCDRLEIFINGRHHASLEPDSVNYPNLKHPPFFTDLTIEGANASRPELRIDGYIGKTVAFSRSFSSDASFDQLLFNADDGELIADGSDATRLVFAPYPAPPARSFEAK
jgi:beta-galactosidase